MFHKILVAIDNSAISQQVFDTALSLAKVMEATLMLLHVLLEDETPAISGISFFNCYPEINQKLRESALDQWETLEKQWLEFLRSSLTLDFAQLRTQKVTFAKINPKLTQNCTSPGKTIREVACSWGADLIVIGSQSDSELNNLVIKSVSNYLYNNAPCSVLVVQDSNSKCP